MPDFSKKNTKESGGKFADRDWTVDEATWLEEARGTKGFVGIYYRWSATDAAGNSENLDWLLGDADKLRSKIVVTDDGILEDVDEDNPYTPRTNDETSQLFNSMEEAGVPMKVLQQIGSNPNAVAGYTFHLVDKPRGYKRKDKDGNETKYDATWLVVGPDGLVSSPDDAKKSKGKSAPATAANAKSKAKTAKDEEPEDDDTDDDGDSAGSDDPIEAAAIATVQTVLTSPKKFIPTYNAKQNGGGVTLTQMSTAALGNAVPKEHRGVGKPAVQKLVKDKKFGGKFDGELWSFDAASGVYSTLED